MRILVAYLCALFSKLRPGLPVLSLQGKMKQMKRSLSLQIPQIYTHTYIYIESYTLKEREEGEGEREEEGEGEVFNLSFEHHDPRHRGPRHHLFRLAVFVHFSQSKSSLLFATDIAARGLDISSVDWVVCMDCPEDEKTYIHRVGRTARFESSGNSSYLHTFTSIHIYTSTYPHPFTSTYLHIRIHSHIHTQRVSISNSFQQNTNKRDILREIY